MPTRIANVQMLANGAMLSLNRCSDGSWLLPRQADCSCGAGSVPACTHMGSGKRVGLFASGPPAMHCLALAMLPASSASAAGLPPFPKRALLAVVAAPGPQAVKMTLALTAVATPINALFGIRAALFLARNEFPGKPLAISILDLPFSISPVITGQWLAACRTEAHVVAVRLPSVGMHAW